MKTKETFMLNVDIAFNDPQGRNYDELADYVYRMYKGNCLFGFYNDSHMVSFLTESSDEIATANGLLSLVKSWGFSPVRCVIDKE